MIFINNILNKWKKTSLPAKASLAYTLGSFVSKGMSVITVPIFTRILSTAEVGISSTYSSWYTILHTIVTLSLCSGSLNIAMMEFPDKRDQYESSCLFLSSLSATLFLILYLLFMEPINRLTTLNSSLMLLICFSLLICPALDFWYARQRYEYKYKASVLMSCGVTIISSVIAVICVIAAKNCHGINLGEVKVLSSGIVQIAVALVIYLLIFKKGKVYIDIKTWKYALALSLPLIVHTLSKNILDTSDRIMISSICGQAEAGIYGTIYSLATIPNILWNSINNATIPTVLESLKSKEYTKLNNLYFIPMIVFGAFSLIVSLLAPEVLKILTTSEYVKSANLIPAIIGGVYFTALYSIYGNLLLFKKKTVYIMFATLGAALLNIVFNFIFIPLCGFAAAAYTTLASFMLLALFQGILVRVVYKEKVLNDGKLVVLSLFITIVCILSTMMYDSFWVRYLLVIIITSIGIWKRKTLLFLLGYK